MKITLDASAAVHHRAGIGRYTQELITALLNIAPQHEYRIFYNRAAEAQPSPPLDRLPQTAFPIGDKPWRLRVLLAHLFQRPQDRLFPASDLLHATDHVLPMLKTPAIFTLFDLTHHFYPQTQASLNRLYLTLILPCFLKAAHAIITISASGRQEAIRLYHIDPEKIHAIPLGVSPNFRPASAAERVAVRQKYRLPEKFLLAVGTIEPRKNLTVLLEVLQMDERLQLAIAGKRGWMADEFFCQLESRGCQERVTLLGRFPDEELPALYSAARACVFPSLYEGFGLPVLEAMACGTPVVCSNTSSMPEVAGKAGLLIAPKDARAFYEAIVAFWDENGLHAEFSERGLRQASFFSWEKTAQQTLSCYQEVSRPL